MITTLQLSLTPQQAQDKAYIHKRIRQVLHSSNFNGFQIVKQAIDARQRIVKINLSLQVYIDEKMPEITFNLPDYPNVQHAPAVIIVGAGPAGLFAALQLIEKGIKPIVIERGKDVQGRRRDLKALNQEHFVNPESNYCFGEGGAGTYSDGKLYTRSKKRGDVEHILKLLVAFGADPNILVEAHPHIGTNKLPKIIQNIRNCIQNAGGEVHFESKLTDIFISFNEIRGIEINYNTRININHLILATGHSARDIYELLYKKNITLEAKPFALGVRAEHPQLLIDQIQYKCTTRDIHLPPAQYSLVKQIAGRGMYSFCMCPGGVIAPCATHPEEIVTNGWSPSKRDQATANSGIVVELKLNDFKDFQAYGPLAGMKFQQAIEHQAWLLGGKKQTAPAQRMVDFCMQKQSQDLPKTSYLPGVKSVELQAVFPKFINTILQEGFTVFGKSMPGYYTNEALLHAPESRTSAPVRIPRNKDTLMHIQLNGLYPCAEGAGYAGGIISAAIDGMRCALALYRNGF